MLVAPALQRRISGARYRAILIGFAAAQSPGFLFSSITGWYDGPVVALMGPLVLSIFGLVVYSALTSRDPEVEAAAPVHRIDASADLVTG